eukprot:GHVN01054104.1.p1 GENE.GHVN01054104.1~~GHVN01054104.1.p1  ORF type:complete len:423 (-),score=77.54 GHVN01054104.1:848-2116(-)
MKLKKAIRSAQSPFTPGATSQKMMKNNKRYLVYNKSGMVTVSGEGELDDGESHIDVECFVSGAGQRSRRIVNELNFDTGAICSTGFALSRRGRAVGSSQSSGLIDESEIEWMPSLFEYYPFDYWGTMAKSKWCYQLPRGDSVECLAVGTEFVAIMTSQRQLRVYSGSGLLIASYRCTGTPLFVVAHEQALLTCCTKSVGATSSGQSDTVLHLQLIDVALRRSLWVGEMSHSSDDSLVWGGISTKGVPLLALVSGEVLGLFPTWGSTSSGVPVFDREWVPVLNLKQASNSLDVSFWVVYGDAEELQVIRLKEFQLAPDASRHHHLTALPYRLTGLDSLVGERGYGFEYSQWLSVLRDDPTLKPGVIKARDIKALIATRIAMCNMRDTTISLSHQLHAETKFASTTPNVGQAVGQEDCRSNTDR